VSAVASQPDGLDVRRAQGAQGLLREFNEAGVVLASDARVALRLASLGSEVSEAVLLAAALAVRAPRLGHVYVDLQTVSSTATVEADEPIDLSALPWPAPEVWTAAVAESELVAVSEEEPGARPLRLVDTHVYLDRYWREERELAADLLALSARDADDQDLASLAAPLERLFAGDTTSRQALAVAAAVVRQLAVVAGGPGTGKTTTVARIAALLAERASARRSLPPLIALAAPTGKAAARLEEAVHEEAERLPLEPAIREQLLGLRASTLHRLLGWRPGSSRFRHDREERLPHDVVIVDETSMVSLSLMAKLVPAIREDGRLILLGDPAQLTSIEAGAVLGDIVGPAARRPLIRSSTRELLRQLTGTSPDAEEPPAGCAIGDGIITLDRGYRFGGGIARLAEAIRRGDGDGAIAVLQESAPDVTWLPRGPDEPGARGGLEPVRDAAAAAARSIITAARAGEAEEALRALGAFRVLCGHRRGPQGVAVWIAETESWLQSELDTFTPEERWYVGRPLIVNHNDYELQLYNGDTGVIVATPEGPRATFARPGGLLQFSPTRLEAVDTVYAMTIHKGQGSQFDTAAVILPPLGSRILTRELLYTAATRARSRLILAATEDALRAAIARPVARASGLERRLWGDAALHPAG
jgi:exodeoxyribonuclease V alpha subunit